MTMNKAGPRPTAHIMPLRAGAAAASHPRMNPAAADQAVRQWIQYDYPDDDFGLKISAYTTLKEGIEKRIGHFDVFYDGEKTSLARDLMQHGFHVSWRPGRDRPLWSSPMLSSAVSGPWPGFVAASSGGMPGPGSLPSSSGASSPGFLPPPYPSSQPFDPWEPPPPYESNAGADAAGPLSNEALYRAPPLEQKSEMVQGAHAGWQASRQLSQSPAEVMIASLGNLTGTPSEKAFKLRFDSACRGIGSMIHDEEDRVIQASLQFDFFRRLEVLVKADRAFEPLARPYLPEG